MSPVVRGSLQARNQIQLVPELPGPVVIPLQPGPFQIRELQEDVLRLIQEALAFMPALLNVPGLHGQEAEGKMLVDGFDRRHETAGFVEHDEVDH